MPSVPKSPAPVFQASKFQPKYLPLQGPNTICQLVAQQDGVRIPRDMVKMIQKALEPEGGAEKCRPGAKRVKARGSLTGLGIFEEVHCDGHEKLSVKSLRMGDGIGIEIYGIRDHTGRIHNMIVVPNSRCSSTVGHVYLDFVDEHQEVGWMGAAQTTLRELFCPDISADERKPVVSVPSPKNIGIESCCILEEGRQRMHLGDEIHRQLWRWLWPRIVQICVNEFVFWFNNHPTRKQSGKTLPSGFSAQYIFDFPKDVDLEDFRQPIDSQTIAGLREAIPITRKEAMRWVSDDFDAIAQQVYEHIGSPTLSLMIGWDIFDTMAPLI
ncbi:hypothetical protein C8J56DRAFT_880841 [Mycena floridula]|nr:hypothetical protein C8J56DRAFT_880841 [Mycena floridula]